MYREPHLNKKSDECAALWYIWFELKQQNDPLAKTARKTWCKCADELSEMIHQEYLTNTRYNNLRM